MWTFIIVGGSNLDFLQKKITCINISQLDVTPFLNQSLLETPKWEVKSALIAPSLD